MTTFSFERYRGQHKRQVAHLQKQLWGSSPAANQRYLEWKYEENPYTQDPLIYIAASQGRVIAMRGVFGALWEVGRERTQLAIPSAADSLIDRSHRDTGLFGELTEFAFDDLRQRGYRYVLNLSPTPANYVASVMTMGWRAIGSVEMVHLPSWRTQVTTSIRSRFRDHAVAQRLLWASRRVRVALPSKTFAHLDRMAARNRPTERSPITVAVEPRPGAMGDLVSRLDNEAGIRHLRDRAFFEWRFRNPRASYRFLFLDRGETIDGYLVLGNLIGRSHVYIADWEATDPEVLAGLLHAAVRWSSARHELQTWSATLSTERTTALVRAGFEQMPTTSRYSGRLLVKSLRDAGADTAEAELVKVLEDIRSWDLRVIYSDGH